MARAQWEELWFIIQNPYCTCDWLHAISRTIGPPDAKRLRATRQPSISRGGKKRDTNHSCSHSEHLSLLSCWIPQREDGKKKRTKGEAAKMVERENVFLWFRCIKKKKDSDNPGRTATFAWVSEGANETWWPSNDASSPPATSEANRLVWKMRKWAGDTEGTMRKHGSGCFVDSSQQNFPARPDESNLNEKMRFKRLTVGCV